METGFNAMGLPVPANRLQKGYKSIQEMCPNFNKEQALNIARRVANFIERDEVSYVIGCVEKRNALLLNLFPQLSNDKWVDDAIAEIDLTGRYRLLAEMLTD